MFRSFLLKKNALKNYILCWIFCCCFQQVSFAQPLKIIATQNDYYISLIGNGQNEMVDLETLIPNIVLDLRYGTKSNFMQYRLYKKAHTTYMRKQPANALLQVQEELNAKGLGLKIFDAYRPYSITKKMWELIHDERYVANPAQGSGHNKGISVDLTIIDLKTGLPLDMGTSFDNFTDSAHHNFTPNLNADIIKNRTLLKNIMLQYGFKILETEWWHYSWVSKESYDVLDFSFKEMKRMVK